MKIVMTACSLVALFFLTAAAQAKDAFLDKALKDIQVVEVKDDKALLRHPGGSQAEVSVGDTIGKEKGIVVELGKASITVEVNDTRVTIPPPFQFGP